MDNKVVFITGASSGIGHETAKLLLKEELTVYATARRFAKMKDLEELGAKVSYVDVTDQSSIDDCISKILEKEGKIDVYFCQCRLRVSRPVRMC
ncbi:SDR family NAD(P)-dependent oxidoreductase [Acetobacterium bakii]|uniref:SDR family NAD(P)-dependent oxidoreductase n=1 Tax=Acetobacterium bakii TaxID=52689 RepID=UPI0006803DBB|nr:SDR family NAD(P)-dependent oxidoreductase [Acetobacterium bakii]